MVDHEYRMTIDLNVLNHLGIHLYSNTPAVISEAVANSWDADAAHVSIDIDKATGVITVMDDGDGMSKADINNKYLKVGYRRRDAESPLTLKKRHVMGRKGIGKLSLFSIADTIEVQSVKRDDAGTVHKAGCVMTAKGIKEAIESGGTEPYRPHPLAEEQIDFAGGTKIILSDLKRNIGSEIFLRRRLARRFSVIGAEYGFSVSINGERVSVEDRDYYKNIQYLWCIGEEGKKYADFCTNCTKRAYIDGVIDAENGYKLSGWVGTFDEQKSVEEGNNTIAVLAWGKMVHEDLLKDIKEGGIYSKYVIGEIRADFLDLDEKDDIATSDRQHLIEDDPRFQKLKDYVQKEIMKAIQNKWTPWRREEAEKKARSNPAIDEWFLRLGPDHKGYARELFAKIESFPVQDPEYKKTLYKHGILAFEALALTKNLIALESISTEEEFEAFRSIFAGIDQLEQVHYYEIAKGRLAVIAKFEEIVDSNAKEKLIQQHIFNHLWLLDPSWERASTDERMEESVMTAFAKIDATLTPEEKAARFDIRYRTAAGKHIIIELKRYARSVRAHDLAIQIQKYRRALKVCLEKAYPEEQQLIECICIVGSTPEPADEPDRVQDILKAESARYITYDELIRKTRDSYRDYLVANKNIQRIQELVDSI